MVAGEGDELQDASDGADEDAETFSKAASAGNGGCVTSAASAPNTGANPTAAGDACYYAPTNLAVGDRGTSAAGAGDENASFGSVWPVADRATTLFGSAGDAAAQLAATDVCYRAATATVTDKYPRSWLSASARGSSLSHSLILWNACTEVVAKDSADGVATTAANSATSNFVSKAETAGASFVPAIPPPPPAPETHELLTQVFAVFGFVGMFATLVLGTISAKRTLAPVHKTMTGPLRPGEAPRPPRVPANGEDI